MVKKKKKKKFIVCDEIFSEFYFEVRKMVSVKHVVLFSRIYSASVATG